MKLASLANDLAKRKKISYSAKNRLMIAELKYLVLKTKIRNFITRKDGFYVFVLQTQVLEEYKDDPVEILKYYDLLEFPNGLHMPVPLIPLELLWNFGYKVSDSYRCHQNGFADPVSSDVIHCFDEIVEIETF